jgi:membrane protein required for colicin V production
MPEVQVVPELIAFAAIFLIVFIAIKIIEMTLRSIIEGVRLGGLDRLLGFFFGLVEGIVIVCLLLFLISIQPLFDPKQIIEESFFAKILMPLIFGNAKEIIESIILPEVPEGAGADV